MTPSPTDVTPSPTDVTPSPTDVTPSPTDVTPPTEIIFPPIQVVPTPVIEITPPPINGTPAPIPEVTPSRPASLTVITPQPTTIPTPLIESENNSNSPGLLSYAEFILIIFLLMGVAPLILLANIGWEHFHSEKIKTSSNLECTLEGVLLDLEKRLRYEQATLESLEKKAWEYKPDSVPQRLNIEIRHVRSCVNAMMIQRAELEKYLRKDDLC